MVQKIVTCREISQKRVAKPLRRPDVCTRRVRRTLLNRRFQTTTHALRATHHRKKI